jgi:hypothetical protein
MGVPHSVLERCGCQAESVVRASRAGGAARASGPVCGQGPGGALRWMRSRSRQVQGTVSTGTVELDSPVAGLRVGSLLPGSEAGRPAGGGSGCGELGAPAGPSSSQNDSERPEQVHLVRALTCFRARAGGPRVPRKVAGVYAQHQNQTS